MFLFRTFPGQGLDHVCNFQISASSAEVILFSVHRSYLLLAVTLFLQGGFVLQLADALKARARRGSL